MKTSTIILLCLLQFSAFAGNSSDSKEWTIRLNVRDIVMFTPPYPDTLPHSPDYYVDKFGIKNMVCISPTRVDCKNIARPYIIENGRDLHGYYMTRLGISTIDYTTICVTKDTTDTNLHHAFLQTPDQWYLNQVWPRLRDVDFDTTVKYWITGYPSLISQGKALTLPKISKPKKRTARVTIAINEDKTHITIYVSTGRTLYEIQDSLFKAGHTDAVVLDAPAFLYLDGKPIVVSNPKFKHQGVIYW